MLSSRTRQASLVALVVGCLSLFLGLATFIGGGARCGGDTGVMAGNTCVTTNGGDYRSTARKVTQAEVDDVRRSQRALGKGGMVVGALLVLGAAGLAARDRRSRRPVRARVSLTAEQACAGGATPVRFRARSHCPHCSGTGDRAGGAGRRCPRCWGSGLGRSRPRTVTVRLPVGVRDGSTLRVRGRGTPGRGTEPAGDLLLSVRIAGPVQRPGTGAPAPRRRTTPAPSRPAAGTAPPRGRAAAPRDAGSGPVTIDAGGIRITAGREGVTVREERRFSGGRDAWVTTHELRWPDIALLVFDSDRHDPVVALYAIPPKASLAGQGRQHLADSRKFTSADWEALAAGIDRHSQGRIALDLASRREPGGLRDS
ncbi:DnaJ C-terminal domain-containing protein [Streptomyces sp. NPDC050421]|uniref:DnaJ C-terminal domain-containing protein n=1 Tax=Streptomyces sp. NPDC050421 TaxID=3365613 RepID=UPI003794D6FF